MPSKEERQAEAKKHIALMKSVFSAETDAAIKSAKFYEDGEGRELPIPEPRFEATATEVTTDFMVTALYKHKGTVALVDPAAFSKPAGGYEEGSFGPEQALCSESNLYPVLSGLKKEYYDKNRGFASGQIYNDHAMYLSDVTFTRNGSIRKAGVVVIAAPNRTRALENHRSPEGIDQALGFRIEALLRIAAANGADTLICNAFGCGALGNDPQQVIGLFKGWLDAHPGVFETVVFAVPRASFDAFDAAFGAPKPEEPAVVATAGDDEDNEFDLDSIELPEGVTLR